MQSLRNTFAADPHVSVCSTVIPDRVAYLNAASLGLPVHRVEPKAAPRSRSRCAADVMRALASELFPEWEQRLAHTRRPTRSTPNSIASVECVTGRPA